jgi:two-component system, chemotaxis family, sensor kinase CheA
MALNLDQLSSVYREEASERLAELEETLLELEQSPTDLELVGRAFRAMHTIKGSGAMFGFDVVAGFTHELETVFDRVRNGAVAVTPQLIALALRARDLIRAMVEGVGNEGEAERAQVVAELRAAAGASPSKVVRPPPPAAASAPASTPGRERIFRVRFRPARDLLQDGTNPVTLLEELGGLGRCEVVANARAVPPLEELDPELCYLGWEAIVVTDKTEDALRDVFIFVEGRCELKVELVDDGVADEAASRRLGEILVAREDVTVEQLKQALAAQPRLGQVLVQRGMVSEDAVEAAALEQKVVREARGRREGAREEASSIRVPATKLDALVDLVGELVIAQARLSQTAATRDDTELLGIAEVMERLSANLRDATLSIRMVPIGTTFARFKRLVHDLSAELGKEIELATDGAETELDKTVIERLGDPLVHLIRNCCDHGLEVPADRVAAGKPPKGTVHLSASYSGASVLIEIRDDGRGLDRAAIRAKAVQKGLIEEGARLTEKELFGLVFLPGFSTARQVSSVSGRGVGLDVVKRSIDGLRGSVELESEAGRGTTLRLKLPLTLAIIDGLLVSVGEGRYVLPMSLVEECVELTAEDVERSPGNQFSQVRGELVPYLRLRDWFGVEGARPPIEQIAIATTDGLRFGLVVDQVVGQHQTVIKSLGAMYRDVQGLSGATILGDGGVALIVDVATLVRLSGERRQRGTVGEIGGRGPPPIATATPAT